MQVKLYTYIMYYINNIHKCKRDVKNVVYITCYIYSLIYNLFNMV